MTELVAWLGLSIMIGFVVVLVLLIFLLLREIFADLERPPGKTWEDADDEH